MIAAAFTSDVGVDNEALTLPSGGYLYFDVNGITPSRERTLAEVKDKVEASWRADEIGKRLKAKADAMLAKLKSGGTLAAVAERRRPAGATGQRPARAARSGGFTPAKLVQAAFTTPQGRAGQRRGRQPDRALRVPGDRGRRAQARCQVAEASRRWPARCRPPIPTTSSAEYIAQLENDIGVSINQTAFNQVVGGGQPGS